MKTQITDAGLNLLASLVEANVNGLAATNERIRENDAARLTQMAKSFSKLYDGLCDIPVHSRSVYVDTLMEMLSWARDEAEQIINPPNN